jgi:flagellar secretion chaperone FliS
LEATLVSQYRAYAAANKMVDEEDKGKVLLKVFEGVLDKLEIIRGAITRRDFETKCEELIKVATIIQVLESSLDMSQGEVAKNLSNLYQYLLKRLREIHGNLRTEGLDECREIIKTIQGGFAEAYEKEPGKPVSGPTEPRPISRNRWI